MKILSVTFLLNIIFLSAFTQVIEVEPKITEAKIESPLRQTPYISDCRSDCLPSFPGGDAALISFLTKNTTYPDSARYNEIQGKVVVKFDIDSNGKILNPIVIRSVNKYLDAEALRVIKHLPNFMPCKTQKNYPFVLPFSFKL